VTSFAPQWRWRCGGARPRRRAWADPSSTQASACRCGRPRRARQISRASNFSPRGKAAEQGPVKQSVDLGNREHIIVTCMITKREGQ
jgi:hypothetical protein